MGVYIKGVEMPKDGSWRSIRIYPDGAIGRPIGFGDYALVEGAKAVPVPPHGRLIDADALMRHKGDCYDADGHLLYAVGTGSILCAPTIIPA